uniref:uncharacterized protein LOC120334656 n=1 Tax=Styela clava TaxID=7725 RepID=UPI00193A0BCB|nr:uncharacterized protein LOC120334656 [Styela clava]
MFKNSEIVNNFTIHNKLQPSGRYIWEPTSDTEKDPFSPIGEETERKKERNHIKWLSDYTKQHTYLTDYKTYLFELECDFEGKQNAWIHTSTQYPTADDIIRIHNRLLDIGFRWSDIYLESSVCTVMQPIDFNSE